MQRRVYGIVAIAFLLGVGGWFYWQASDAATEFDATNWRENVRDGLDTPRLRMADGLLRSKTLLGKTRTEIEAMLGPMSKSEYFREYDLVYWLGPERGFVRIDSEWLVMRLADGRVAEARLVTD